MKLASRISRIEALHGGDEQRAVIIAVDDADFNNQFLDAWLHRRPGSLTVSRTIAGEAFKPHTIPWRIHEEWLEELDADVTC